MRFLPDRYVEDIRIYRPAISEEDVDSEHFFVDPFVRPDSPYGNELNVRGGVILAEGDAYIQEDRANIYRKILNIDSRAISFFGLFILVRCLDRELPRVDYGNIDVRQKQYLWRMNEYPNILARQTIVYARYYPSNDNLQLYTVDEREGTRTSLST